MAFLTVTGGASVVAASDLTKVYGSIPPSGAGISSPLAFSADDAQINGYSSRIGVFNPANCQMLRAIDIGWAAYDSALLVDSTNRVRLAIVY